MFEHKQAVIFDLDGTLVDSMWMWKDIDIEFLARYGLSCPDDLQKAIEGMSFSETAAYFKNRFHLDMSIDELKAIWTEMSIDKYRRQVPLKPGVRQVLSRLKASGIRLGIATSNGIDMVNAVMMSLKLTPYFDNVTTGCQVANGKPSPDIYLHVAGRLGVGPDQCLVFEDVPAGILAGKRAGMEVCAVEDNDSPEVREEKIAMADYYLSDFSLLLDGELSDGGLLEDTMK